MQSNHGRDMRLDLYPHYLDTFNAVRAALQRDRTERVSGLVDEAERRSGALRAVALLATSDAAASSCPPRSRLEILREVRRVASSPGSPQTAHRATCAQETWTAPADRLKPTAT